MPSLVLGSLGMVVCVVVVGGGWLDARRHRFSKEREKNGDDVSCGTERDDSAVGMF